MALYALGDTHLSPSAQKAMDVFGGAWSGYVDKLRRGLSVLQEEDTLVLCGDLSWGMSLEQAREDGMIGIPCFVREDGSITLNPADVLKEAGLGC